MRSDSCPAEAGFTLLEIVVVLAIIALTSAFALPRLGGWLESLQSSSEQQRFEESLAGLGGEARRIGHTLVLRSTADDASKAADAAPIDLPPGWKLEAKAPIIYRYDGMCSGGTVRVVLPGGGDSSYRLAPPYCRPQPL